jgi:hypothetical protein
MGGNSEVEGVLWVVVMGDLMIRWRLDHDARRRNR